MKKLIKKILKEETEYYHGEEFFTLPKEFLDRIIERLLEESYPLKDWEVNSFDIDADFFYGWVPSSPPHVAPELLGARHYNWLKEHLEEIYDISNPREIDYIWDKYYRKLLTLYV